MDLVKIGRYVAAKRKDLGLTQKQLAERLGMSDKSVSKWERGVCLPDVSLYEEYCALLGISINEFLAGEDIAGENILRKSEDNLIQVTTDSKSRQIRLKVMIAVLAAVLLMTAAVISVLLLRAGRPLNYIVPLDADSVEMKTAELLSGVDGAFLYRYRADGGFRRLTVSVTEYRAGEQVNRENHVVSYESTGSPGEGMICIVPDFEHFTLKLVIADQGGKLAAQIPILEGVRAREYFGRSASRIEAETPIRYGEEQAILALLYDDDIMHVLNIREFESGNIPADNDEMYLFSVCFSK